MLKRLSIAIMLVLGTILWPGSEALCTVPAGQWVFHPSFAPPAGQVITTSDNKTFFTSAGALFCYDADADESFSFTPDNYLTDVDIDTLFHNPADRYIMVTYTSGNIDIVYYGGEDFRVVNFSDIRDADLTASKHINAIEFANGCAYIATDFGLVVYDTSLHQVKQSGNYGIPVEGVAVEGDYIYIYAEEYLRSIPRSSRINSYSSFTPIAWWGKITGMRRIEGRNIALLRPHYTDPAYHLTVMVVKNDGSYQGSYSYPTVNNPSGFIDFADGTTGLILSDGRLVSFKDGHILNDVCNIAPIDPLTPIAVGKDASAVWNLTEDGIGSFDMSGVTPVVTVARFLPENLATSNVAYIIPGIDPSRMWLTNLGCTVYRGAGNGEGYDVVQQTTVREADGSYSDYTLRGYRSSNSIVASNQECLRTDRPLAVGRVAESPHDPSIYYVASANDGVICVKDGKLLGKYDDSNSPMKRISVGCRVYEVTFDPDGNLWLVHMTGADNGAILMLPAAKVKADPATVKVTDWKVINAPGFSGDKDARLLFLKKSKVAVAFDCRFAHGLVVINTKGTYDNLSDDVVSVVTSFTDQDGKAFNLGTDRFTSLAEDRRGRLWLGSTSGVIEITNPAAVNSSAVQINRLKVPRNDGTNSADYLLGSDLIYDIVVDHANRKWIATEVSGLYLVNESGNEILEHFTAENSPLRSNMINALYVEPAGNSLFVATGEGLYEYGGDSSEPMADYEELIAYPNPVRPDYDGPVTITGLREGSLVKISDSAGNVIAQLSSEGGMAVWDASDASGKRVRSGVYFVLGSAPAGDNSGPKGGVTKIVVVN